MNAKKKKKNNNLHYADDIELIAEKAKDMQLLGVVVTESVKKDPL